MSSSYQFILVEQRGAVSVITVNRPDKLNAINRATLEEIGRAVGAFVADDSQGALIVTGSGQKAFIAGADIGELQPLGPSAAEDISRFGQAVVDQLEHSPKPTIAAVNGFALGGGCELSLGCHIRIASENAVFGLPEVGLGIIPGYGGTVRLPRLVGQGRALEIVLTGRKVKADEAAAIGLVNRVVPQAELMAEAEKLANAMLEKGPLAVQAAIESVVRGGSLSVAEALRFESGRFGIVASTDDMHEGLQAFLDKRPPVFKRS
jgi:enoyl-CoA hydratase